ncbi:hypothetical protein [Gillisia marina]|uniref:hypothetical protein n=1 Tax=Gillisia marina TaxID=1167637 RepID=UPI0002ED05AC|nr:hypothetical protein [Gillisia marina]
MVKQLVLIVALIATLSNFAQEAHSGEIIKEYGKIYEVSNPDFKTDTTAQYKVVFDIGRSFDKLRNQMH